MAWKIFHIVAAVLGLTLIRVESVQSKLVKGLLNGVDDTLSDVGETVSNVTSDVTPILQDEVTAKLCNLKTNELCAYYGYVPEVHYVTTEDGYILTLFRCRAPNVTTQSCNVLVLHHGLLSSTDDFVINPPDQGMAYFFIDRGYDVWMANNRGNVYSRRHVTKDPDDPASGFWKFSWDDIGFYDFPAVYDYVRKETGVSKLYAAGHSEGTSSLMALISTKPEYNEYFHTVSLMAPISYLYHSGILYQILAPLGGPLKIIRDRELLPRGALNDVLGTVCDVVTGVCDGAINVLLGPSNDRNKTMVPTILCHFPSGSSSNQILHYAQEVEHDFFGRPMVGTEIPPDFPLEQIEVPISLHYSLDDPFTNPIDVNKLISKLTRTIDLLVKIIKKKPFDHADFVYGKHAPSLVYGPIYDFHQKHGECEI